MRIVLVILLISLIVVNIIYFMQKRKIFKELDRLEKEYNIPNRLRKNKNRKKV